MFKKTRTTNEPLEAEYQHKIFLKSREQFIRSQIRVTSVVLRQTEAMLHL